MRIYGYMLTIIIPTLNSERYLRQCLASLARQEDKKFKVLLVDDGSRDQTIPITRGFRKALKIKILKKSSKIARGAAASINSAVPHVTTPYIALIDSDAVMKKNWTRVVLGILRRKKNILVGAPILASREDTLWSFVTGLEIESRYYRRKEGYLKHLSTCNLAGPTNLFRRYPHLDEDLLYAYDHDLSNQMLKHNIRYYLTLKTSCYHYNKGGLGSYFKQQYRIGLFHGLLALSHPRLSLSGQDDISPRWLILQPILFIVMIIMVIYKSWAAAAIGLLLIATNGKYLVYLAGRKEWSLLPLAIIAVLIRAFAWSLGIALLPLAHIKRKLL